LGLDGEALLVLDKAETEDFGVSFAVDKETPPLLAERLEIGSDGLTLIELTIADGLAAADEVTLDELLIALN
jgi:hypothetical protein